MPVTQFIVVTKSQGRYKENWNYLKSTVVIDTTSPEKYKTNWQDWFSRNPDTDLGGTKADFYKFDTETGVASLFHSVTILNLKKQPRILNDGSPSLTKQTQTSLDLAGEEAPAFGSPTTVPSNYSTTSWDEWIA
jgi:hypothetical protein